MNEPKEVQRKVGGYNVTITLKGYNPDIKNKILDLLCDNFEHRVMNGARKGGNNRPVANNADEKDYKSDNG